LHRMRRRNSANEESTDHQSEGYRHARPRIDCRIMANSGPAGKASG
jgi:hypothetical protein